MKDLIMMLALMLAVTTSASAQKYFTKSGNIKFFSEAPLENIEATSDQVMTIVNAETGDLVFKMQIKTFQFDKALMQEHFNEKYMESEKYPDAQFKGQITNMDKIDLSADGTSGVMVKGDLTIHGVTKSIELDGKLTVKDGKLSCEAVFPVNLADYNVKIPGAVKDNIAETVEVTVKASYEKMNK